MNVDRWVRDGYVAVIYSPGYGAGWSSWTYDEKAEGLMFDGDVARAVDDGRISDAVRIAHERYGDFYDGGAGDLSVAWVPQGSLVKINEYDGSESVEVFSDSSFYKA